MKSFSLILVLFLIITSCFTTYAAQDTTSWELFYTKVTGFGIPNEEREAISGAGGNATYGEILPKSVRHLLTDLKLTKEDVFYDLGSGVGKVAVQVYFESPVQKSVGVELSDTRHAGAMQVYDQLKKNNKLQDGRSLVLLHENILDTNIQDATVIFLCSTCYSNDLMESLADRIQALKPGARVLTLKKFKDRPTFKLVKVYELPMTWSESNTVHLYEVT